jgi:carbonic anhydrase
MFLLQTCAPGWINYALVNNPKAQEALQTLLEGNERFRTGKSLHRTYTDRNLRPLAASQSPIAAVISCVDSRVAPEIFFDQPLGSIFVSRVPGNVASDSAKWMIDIAVGELKVPLLVVVGHTGCLAVGQIVQGKSGPGGLLRFKVQSAVQKAKNSNPEDLYHEAVKVNALQTVEHLENDSWEFRDALRSNTTCAIAAIYNMDTGKVEVLS